jgi:hypothetical protein
VTTTCPIPVITAPVYCVPTPLNVELIRAVLLNGLFTAVGLQLGPSRSSTSFSIRNRQRNVPRDQYSRTRFAVL